MFILEALLVLFWILIVPLLIGTFVVNQLFREKNTDALLALVCGFIVMLSVFYLLAMPMLFMKLPLKVLVISWSVMMLSICTASLVMNRRRFKEIISHNLSQIKKIPWIMILVIILILAQAFILARYVHEDADDAFYVASATTSVATDSIFHFDSYTGAEINSYPTRYVFSPFPVFVALLSNILMIHPAIIAHTVMPAVLIPLSYIVFALIGKKLFPHHPTNVAYFLLFLCVLNVFGNISVYTNSTFLLFRIWQGKAVLANIILPAIIYFFYRAMSEEEIYGQWIMIFACSLAACLSSSMGIVIVPVLLVGLGFVYALSSRKFRTLLFSAACCIPCVICGIASLII